MRARHIVLTHLDFDHAGGLDDFSEAQVHLHVDEAEAANARRGWVSRGRYRPAQWNTVDRWQFYRPGGEPWFGFSSVRSVAGRWRSTAGNASGTSAGCATWSASTAIRCG